MKIILSGKVDIYNDERVHTYFTSIWDSLLAHGHQVKFIQNTEPEKVDKIGGDLLLDVDCGRHPNGDLRFIVDSGHRFNIPSAVIFTDSHGNPVLNRRLARKYDHVFYAVWDKRELFGSHPSAHWLPNYTDMKYFGGEKYKDVEPEFDFGMFGSKKGLDRAKPMIELCEKFGWTYDVRQLGGAYKHRWPATAAAMANCRYLFNHGQKWDLNFRVFESMAVGRCLINDVNPRSGIDQLFKKSTHYIGYESVSYGGLEDAMLWCKNNPSASNAIARNAFNEVSENHTVHNRVETILKVVGDAD